MIPPFEYKYQNPTGFACLVLTRAIAIHNLPYNKQFNNLSFPAGRRDIETM